MAITSSINLDKVSGSVKSLNTGIGQLKKSADTIKTVSLNKIKVKREDIKIKVKSDYFIDIEKPEKPEKLYYNEEDDKKIFIIATIAECVKKIFITFTMVYFVFKIM